MSFRKGFTLIELLIVVTILAVLAGAAIPYVADYVEDSRFSKAKVDLDELKNAIALYETKRGDRYTGTDGSTLVNTGYLNRLPIDPWGAPYVVDPNTCEVYSRGSDGVQGGGDDVKTTYAPPLAITAAYWWDVDQSSTVNLNDRILCKFTRRMKTPTALTAVSITTAPQPVLANCFFIDADATQKQYALGFGAGIPLFVPGKDKIVIGANSGFQDFNTTTTYCNADSIKILAR